MSREKWRRKRRDKQEVENGGERKEGAGGEVVRRGEGGVECGVRSLEEVGRGDR